MREINMGDHFMYLYASVSKPLSHKELFCSIFVGMFLYGGRSVNVQECLGNARLNKNKETF